MAHPLAQEAYYSLLCALAAQLPPGDSIASNWVSDVIRSHGAVLLQGRHCLPVGSNHLLGTYQTRCQQLHLQELEDLLVDARTVLGISDDLDVVRAPSLPGRSRAWQQLSLTAVCRDADVCAMGPLPGSLVLTGLAERVLCTLFAGAENASRR